MLKWLALTATAAVWLVYFRNRARDEKLKTAAIEHDAMYLKYRELCEDPLISDLAWQEWLPLFEYADWVYARRNYPGREFTRLADLVRRAMA